MQSYQEVKFNKILNYLVSTLIILIFISLIHGYSCKYLTRSLCKDINFLNNFLQENGFIENIQSLTLLVSIIIFLSLIKLAKTEKIIQIFIYLKILALIYYLGEEISWGQHFFKWNTPELFNEINNQKETNLHNISNLLDQLPRSLVILWCGFIPIIFYFLKMKINFKRHINLIILPKTKLLVVSIIFLFFFLPDFIVDKANLHPGWHIDGQDIKEAKIYDTFTFNFLERLSEIHELIFCFYFLIYSISFKQAIKDYY